jgi:hypothetical protein
MKGNFQDRNSSNNSSGREEFNKERRTNHIYCEYGILSSIILNINPRQL